jgi:hypothetical protein
MAFSFLTALVLALLTAAYVVLTARLAASQQQATRASVEPVLIARTTMTDRGLRVTVKNASTAVASDVRLYTGSDGIAIVRERPSDIALFAGEEAHFHLDRPDADEQDALVVLWGGAEILYADAHETTLWRTRVFITEYRDPSRPAEWVQQVGVARQRHERKELLGQASRLGPAKHEDPRETWPLSALWIAANDPTEGLVVGHP